MRTCKACRPYYKKTFYTYQTGIGAGNECDGQVLVYQDMLGMFSDYVPKFVKQFANVGDIMKQAFKDYINEVSDQTFPDASRSYTIDDDVLERLY